MVVVVRLVGRLRKVLGLGLRCGTGPVCGVGHLMWHLIPYWLTSSSDLLFSDGALVDPKPRASGREILGP